MRTLLLLPLLVVAAALPVLLGPSVRADDAPPPPLPDLRLEAWLVSDPVVVPGEPVRLGAKLRNTSKTRSHPVVRPGDGSECGWREPHVFYTAVRVTREGAEVQLPDAGAARCGNYDPAWTDDVVGLQPGEALDLTPVLLPASLFFDFQEEGEVRVRLHYRWTEGRAGQGLPEAEPTNDLGGMKGVAAFEVVSEPVRVRVHRVVDVSLRVIGAMKVGEAATLDRLIEVTVTNRTAEPIDVRPQQLQFVVRRRFPGGVLGPVEDVPPSARVRAAPLKPGEVRTYRGAENFRLFRGLRLRALEPGRFELTATWAPGATDRGPKPSPIRIRSRPVLVEVRGD